MKKIKLYGDIYYRYCCISNDEDTGKYEVTFGHSENGADYISTAPCDTIDNAILFINKISDGEFKDDDDACDYANERWGD